MDADGAGSEPLLARTPTAIWRRTLRGVLVSGDADSEPMLITSPGDTLWDLLETARSRADLISALAEMYDVDETTVSADLHPLLDQLLDMRLIVIAG